MSRLPEVFGDVVLGLRRSRSFTLVAILTLALAVGLNSALFSIFYGVLLRALPYQDQRSLVVVGRSSDYPPGVYAHMRQQTALFKDLAAVSKVEAMNLVTADGPSRIDGAFVSANLFSLLGVRPSLGRNFEPGDDQPGGATPVLLSDGLWRQRFGGRADIVGQRVTVDGIRREVVGVLPAALAMPGGSASAWVPLTLSPNDIGTYWGHYKYALVGRLSPSVTSSNTTTAVRSQLAAAGALFPWPVPDGYGRDVDLVELRAALTDGIRPLLNVLMLAVLAVLAVAMVNAAAVSVVRTLMRSRETAIRAAVGADTSWLVSSVLVESVVIGGVAAALGMALGWLVLRLVLPLLPMDLPLVGSVRFDAVTVAVTFVLAVAASLLAGIVPARAAAGADLRGLLASGARGSSAGRGRQIALNVLVSAQFALAMTLGSLAILVVRSAQHLYASDLGFKAQELYVAELPLPSFVSDSQSRGRAYLDAVRARVLAAPGIESAAAMSNPPFASLASGGIEPEATPTPHGADPPRVTLGAGSTGLFRALGTPVLRGRELTDADRAGAAPVAIIDAAAAQKIWPNVDPIGQRLRYLSSAEWMTIVGVVGNVRRDSLTAPFTPSVYTSALQAPFLATFLMVRSALPPTQVRAIVDAAVHESDGTLALGPLRSMSTLIDRSAAQVRLLTGLLILFAVVSLVLGGVGLYGVVSYAVAMRHREFGIRMAIGATAAQVMRGVVLDGLRVTAIGVCAGSAVALAASFVLRNRFWGIQALDPLSVAAAACLLCVAGMAATIVPARRATRADPLDALHAE